MGKKPVCVILCDCSPCMAEKVDTKRIKNRLLENENIKEVLVAESPCMKETSGLKKISADRAVIGGCSILENRGIYDKIIASLDLARTNYAILDMRTAALDLYGSNQGKEENIIKQIISKALLLSAKEEVSFTAESPYEKILIYGSGVSGLTLAGEIPRDIPVDILEIPVDILTGENGMSPGFLSAEFAHPRCFRNLKDNVFAKENVTSISLKDLLMIVPEDRGFRAIMKNGKTQTYGAVVFSPERVETESGVPGAVSLSQLYKRMKKQNIEKGVAVFIMDHGSGSGPEVYYDMLYAACFVKEKTASEVFVLAKDIQVCIGGLEEFYDACRSKGIVFLKYDQELILENNNGRLSVRGTCSQATGDFRFEKCDLVVVPGRSGLSPESLRFADMLNINLPEKRYSQADSLWVLPNQTDRTGVFTAGISRENFGPGDINSDISSCVFGVTNYIRGKGAVVKEHIPVVDEEACAYCLTCVRLCPFGAMTKNPEQGAAKVIQSACQGCGVCAGECPAGAIEMRNMGMAEIGKSITSLVQ